MHQPSVNRGSSVNAFSASPLLKNSTRCTDPWQVCAVLKHRRCYFPEAGSANQPIHLPPLHGTLAYAHYGTISDPDPDIRSHMRALLQASCNAKPQSAIDLVA